MSPIGEGYNRAKIAQKVRFNGSAGSSFAGSTTPTISSALSNLPASSSSSNDFEIGSSTGTAAHSSDAHSRREQRSRMERRSSSRGGKHVGRSDRSVYTPAGELVGSARMGWPA